jgi:ABC-type multidrug transport system ATPase subunit
VVCSKTAGRSTGAVKVNGHDKEPAAFARVMGYCEQSDVHSSGATVEESVRTSGRLRLGSDVTREQARFLCPVLLQHLSGS